MAKIYFEKKFELDTLQPKEETVNFLLNYSKALSVINCNGIEFEALLN